MLANEIVVVWRVRREAMVIVRQPVIRQRLVKHERVRVKVALKRSARSDERHALQSRARGADRPARDARARSPPYPRAELACRHRRRTTDGRCDVSCRRAAPSHALFILARLIDSRRCRLDRASRRRRRCGSVRCVAVEPGRAERGRAGRWRRSRALHRPHVIPGRLAHRVRRRRRRQRRQLGIRLRAGRAAHPRQGGVRDCRRGRRRVGVVLGRRGRPAERAHAVA